PGRRFLRARPPGCIGPLSPSTLGKKSTRQHPLRGKRGEFGEDVLRPTCLSKRSRASNRARPPQRRRHVWPKAGRLAEDPFDLQPLLVDCRRATSRLRRGLMTPFQQVHDQNDESALELSSIAPTHAFNFLGYIGSIDGRQLARAQE